MLLLQGIAQTKTGAAISLPAALETIIQSSLNYYVDSRMALEKTYHQEEDWLGNKRRYNYTVYKTTLAWPGATTAFIENRQDDVAEIQQYSFVAHLPSAASEEAAMRQLQKQWDLLHKAVVQVVPGQKDTLKGTLKKLEGREMYYSSLLSRNYVYKGRTRDVWVAVRVHHTNGIYVPSLHVRVGVNGMDIVYRKQPEEINKLITAAFTNFQGQYTEVHQSKNSDLGKGISISRVEYLSPLKWPDMLFQRVIHEKGQRNGISYYEGWSYISWQTSRSYEWALQYYKKVFDQINGCTVTTPTGKSYVLSAAYKEPSNTVAGTKTGLIEFGQMYAAEKVSVDIQLLFQNDVYYVQVKVSRAVR